MWNETVDRKLARVARKKTNFFKADIALFEIGTVFCLPLSFFEVKRTILKIALVCIPYIDILSFLAFDLYADSVVLPFFFTIEH